ncbi:hypothetical protein CVT26_009243 [Gymnopilus dilepis]|uniref:Uncharacterized protein n=1 Tax=Gymnopilus dilepis TaxID=231916 RepID=A0A409YRN5_9AGAR|nr:hypothetical protein CVT26_009243 [Gymnopilus dilepis]
MPKSKCMGVLEEKGAAEDVLDLLSCDDKDNTMLVVTNTDRKRIYEPGSDSGEVGHPLSRIAARLRSHTVLRQSCLKILPAIVFKNNPNYVVSSNTHSMALLEIRYRLANVGQKVLVHGTVNGTVDDTSAGHLDTFTDSELTTRTFASWSVCASGIGQWNSVHELNKGEEAYNEQYLNQSPPKQISGRHLQAPPPATTENVAHFAVTAPAPASVGFRTIVLGEGGRRGRDLTAGNDGVSTPAVKFVCLDLPYELLGDRIDERVC